MLPAGQQPYQYPQQQPLSGNPYPPDYNSLQRIQELEKAVAEGNRQLSQINNEGVALRSKVCKCWATCCGIGAVCIGVPATVVGGILLNMCREGDSEACPGGGVTAALGVAILVGSWCCINKYGYENVPTYL